MPHVDLGKLLGVLFKKADALSDAVAANKNEIENGLVSVGLKIHLIGNDTPFNELFRKLGGRAILEQNVYKHTQAVSCLVLPPVGNATAAINLVSAIERYTEYKLFENDNVQIQVCSPGRLDQRRAAMLGVGYYLGSAKLRRYTIDDFDTTVSADVGYRRGRRLVIYDAGGFERHFGWWGSDNSRLKIAKVLPFEKGRSDVLIRGCTISDIENINLLASMLIHAQERGYWEHHGLPLEKNIDSLLDRHLLSGILDASWVKADNGPINDKDFACALSELVSYVYDESSRIQKFKKRLQGKPGTDPKGILFEMQQVLQTCRLEVTEECSQLERGEMRA